MTKTTAEPEVAGTARDPARRRDLAGIISRLSTRARWIISAALVTPAVLIADGAAAPIAQAIACVGNGSFMALAASANAFTLIP